jgi:hypothetical protein
MCLNNLHTFPYRESVLKGGILLLNMPKSMHMLIAAMTHPAEGLCLNALLTLKVENFHICLVGGT